MKNGVEINSESNEIRVDRYSIEAKSAMSMFTLHDIDTDDSANYSCVLFQQNGQFDQQWTYLQVNGAFIICNSIFASEYCIQVSIALLHLTSLSDPIFCQRVALKMSLIEAYDFILHELLQN